MEDLLGLLFSAKYVWLILVFVVAVGIFFLKAALVGIVGGIMFGLIGAIFGETGMVIGAIFGFCAGLYGGLKGDG